MFITIGFCSSNKPFNIFHIFWNLTQTKIKHKFKHFPISLPLPLPCKLQNHSKQFAWVGVNTRVGTVNWN